MMDRKEILKKIIPILSNFTEETEITEDSELIDDLGISSMDVLTLTTYLEADFNKKIPEKLIREMSTVGDIVDILDK